MADVVEVIHKITYDIDDRALQNVNGIVQQQMRELARLTDTLRNYQRQLNSTRSITAIDDLGRKIDTVTKQINVNVVRSKTLVEQFGSGLLKGLGIDTDIESNVAKFFKPLGEHLFKIKDQGKEASGSIASIGEKLLSFSNVAPPAIGIAIALARELYNLATAASEAEIAHNSFIASLKNTADNTNLNIRNQVGTVDRFQKLINFAKDDASRKNFINELKKLYPAELSNKKDTDFTGAGAKALFSDLRTRVANTQRLQGFNDAYLQLNEELNKAKEAMAKTSSALQKALERQSQLSNRKENDADKKQINAIVNYLKEKVKRQQEFINNIKAIQNNASSYAANLPTLSNAPPQTSYDNTPATYIQQTRTQITKSQPAEEKLPSEMKSLATGKVELKVTYEPIEVTAKEVPGVKFPRVSLRTQGEQRIAYLKTVRDQSKNNLSLAQDELKNAKKNDAPEAEIKQLKTKVKEARRILQEDRSALRKEQGENLKQYIDGYKQITQAAVDAYQTITDAQIRALDKEIEIRQKRVDAATKLAERGNTEVLRIEEERLNKAQKKREEIARKQMIVNAALAVSNAIVGVAETATTGPAAIVLIPAVIAAIIAGYAAVSAVTKESAEQAFADGVVGYKGKGGPRDDMNRVWISSGESVITAEGTAKNRALLESINKGAQFSMLAPQLNPMYQLQSPAGGGYASRGEMHTLEKKMDTLIDAVSANGTTVHANVDERGLSLMTVKQVKRDQNRFR